MADRNASPLPPHIKIRNDIRPGDIGMVTYLHGTLYAEAYGWDPTFEAYVAGPLAEFVKSHSSRERIWLVEHDGRLAGSVAIVDAGEGRAQLRWLLLHPDLRGYGLGRRLVEEAIGFSRAHDYHTLFLWTVTNVAVAIGLYRSLGFHLTEEAVHPLWGDVVTEQRYELALQPVP